MLTGPVRKCSTAGVPSRGSHPVAPDDPLDDDPPAVIGRSSRTVVEPVRIDDIAVGGAGVGRLDDGRVAFVRSAFPGDLVRIRLEQVKPRYVHARIVGVDEPSPDRVAAPCPEVERGCGGCDWQALDLARQTQWKQHVVQTALQRLGGVDIEVGVGPELAASGYRTTLRCTVDHGELGFLAARSDEAIGVESCLIAHPKLAPLFDVDWRTAETVLLRTSVATGEVLAVVGPAVPPGLHVPGEVAVVGWDEVAAGADAAITEVVAGHRFRVSAKSFFQPSPEGAAALVDAVRAGAGGWPEGALVDLFGGVGLFAVALGDGRPVTLVESSASAVGDAQVNLDTAIESGAATPLDPSVVKARVERWRPSPAAIVIADPPRTGLAVAGVAKVAATHATHLALISCDAGSLGRDVALLREAGFEPRSATLVDQFRHTHHVEVVTHFARRSSGVAG